MYYRFHRIREYFDVINPVFFQEALNYLSSLIFLDVAIFIDFSLFAQATLGYAD